ncbi:anti-anti-sigma factor [Symbioplanes lichenis]|uniref:anti-anti-sigma factor n=1 Tax=Symbioplanes lichenis TaxID=1629072 RepID=UPI0027389EB4|nr:anti-anti-sigma factor [Actinoplanes lichenis]
MPSEVRHRVDDDRVYPVVRLDGILDAGSAPQLRAALLGVLGDQPEAVVVDVRDLTLGRREAAGVLADVAREAADWPGARLVLCTGAEQDGWHATGLPAEPDVEAALAGLGRPHRADFLSLALEPVVGAARRSRELIAEACARWDLVALAGPACIVVTELVNNVVAHSRTAMTVFASRRGERLLVAVRDRSATVPRFTGSPVPVTSYGGRGLLLIDSVAERWGALALPGGKVVWAALSRAHEQAQQAAGFGPA